FVVPPKPRHRAIGTSASKPSSSARWAISLVCSQVTLYVVGAWVIVRPWEQLVPNSPSFIFWSLNIGFVLRRSTRGSVSSRGRGAVGFSSRGMISSFAQQGVWPSAELERVAGRAGQLDPDGLHLGVVVERAEAAERGVRRQHPVGVHPYRAGPQLGGNPMGAVHIFRPDRSGQPVRGVVGQLERFFLGAKGQRGHNRAEDF